MQQVAIAQPTMIERQFGKEVAVEWRYPQLLCQFFIAQHVPERTNTVPEVNIVGVGVTFAAQPYQARDAVMIAVEVGCAEQASLFGDEQKEDTVDQAQQIAVELKGVWRLIAGSEKAIGEGNNCLLHPFAQAFTDAPTLFERGAVILFEQAAFGVGVALR